MKIIFHIDLDSYFVSVERIVNPSLNKRSIVIARSTSKSIITAASYEAKNRGIKVGTPLFLARQKDPNLIVVKPNYNLYTHFSNKVFEYINKHFTSQIEVASIDECYLDATALSKRFVTPFQAARVIQSQILKVLKLPLSIGISNNKFVAKMSTQVNKPFGITQIWDHEFLAFFGKWNISKYHGIGRSLAPKLKQVGIKTINDLARAQPLALQSLLGKNTKQYIARANGLDNDPIDLQAHNLKSIGNSITLINNKNNNWAEMLAILSDLCHLVANRCDTHNVVGNVVTVAIKTKHNNRLQRYSKQTTIAIPIQNYELVYQEASALFYHLWRQSQIYFISVTLTKLESAFATTYQMRFGEQKDKTNPQKIIQKINNKFKQRVVFLGKEQLSKTNHRSRKPTYQEKNKFLKRS